MQKLKSTRVEGANISLFMMSEGESFGSFSETETDSMLSGSVYYPTENSDASSVAYLLLPVLEESDI